MSIDLGRRLIAAGLVPSEEVEAALFVSVARGVPFARVLIDRGAITERGLEEELERLGGLGLRQVAGAAELVARLPRAMCRRLAALPTRLDTHTGTIDVAAADPLDPNIAAEFGFHLGASVRVVRAPIAAIEEAIRRLELSEPEPREKPRERRKTPPFPHGAPQSSVPPPVLEEAPIPLVRKAPGGSRETIPIEPPAARDTPKPASPRSITSTADAPPTSLPFTMGAVSEGPITPHRGTIRPDRPHDEAPSAAAAAPVPTASTRAAGEPPSVSFPSLPPESIGAGGARHTPPYGTPLLAPPAAPVDLGPRPAADPPRAPLMPADPSARADDSDRVASLPPEPTRAIAAGDAGDEAARPNVVRAPDARPILDALDRASSRDDVIRQAMRGVRLVARRIGVFAVKREGFTGWACNVDMGDPDAFRALVVPADAPSVLATATATAIYLGPIPETPAHAGLLAVMEHRSPDVAAVACRVAGRPVLVLLADELDDTMTGTRTLIELAEAVGEALSRVLSGR